MRIVRLFCTSLLLVIALTQRASAFALIGPDIPGMATNAMGSAMNIGQGYRWNVPVVTYAYDQSFLDFFGTNGAAAVDSAIQILNALPPASTLDPNAYPTNAINFPPPPPIIINGSTNTNTFVSVLDLRSAALSLVLREMGLASPIPFLFELQPSVSGGMTNYNVIMRNFDPITDAPSSNINGEAFHYQLVTNQTTGQVGFIGVGFAASSISAAGFADFLDAGTFLNQISYDDAGGLAYLLSTNNVALENLIPGVSGAGTNAGNYVTTAPRPGVDKVTFQRVSFDSILGQIFPPLTNQYVDSYVSNGVLYHQNLQRVITQPDIVFSSAGLNNNINFTNSSTVGWANNALPGQPGPGVIQPPINITFNRLGLRVVDSYTFTSNHVVSYIPPWGSFDVSTNNGSLSLSDFIIYPGSSAPSTMFNLLFYASPGYFIPFASFNGPYNQVSWNLPGPAGTTYLLQSSSDLLNWTNIVAITNNGSSISCMEQVSNAPQSFFRTIPQP